MNVLFTIKQRVNRDGIFQRASDLRAQKQWLQGTRRNYKNRIVFFISESEYYLPEQVEKWEKV
jgi:hypothetical protein